MENTIENMDTLCRTFATFCGYLNHISRNFRNRTNYSFFNSLIHEARRGDGQEGPQDAVHPRDHARGPHHGDQRQRRPPLRKVACCIACCIAVLKKMRF